MQDLGTIDIVCRGHVLHAFSGRARGFPIAPTISMILRGSPIS